MNGIDEVACRGAAYHESGHIVAAIALGLPISPKGIRIGGFADGNAFFKGADTDAPVSASDVGRVVIALLAGGVAHACVRPEVSVARGDEERIAQILAEPLDEPTAREARRSELLQDAKLLIDQHWESVSNLAEELDEKVWQPTRPNHCLPVEKSLSASEIQKAMPHFDVIVDESL